MKKASALLCALAIGQAVSVSAVTVGFDDLASTAAVPAGYEGIASWENLTALHYLAFGPGTAYANVKQSNFNVAYNKGKQVTITDGAPFNLESGWFTSAYTTDTLWVTGYWGGVAGSTMSVPISKATATLVPIGLEGVDKVTIWSRLGSAGSWQIAMDDLTISRPAPPPIGGLSIPDSSEYSMLIALLGLFGFGWVSRRKPALATTR